MTPQFNTLGTGHAHPVLQPCLCMSSPASCVPCNYFGSYGKAPPAPRTNAAKPTHHRPHSLQAAVLEALPGAQLPDVIEAGHIVRFHVDGADGDFAGWVKLFDGGRAGCFGCRGVLRVQKWVSPAWKGFRRQDLAAVAEQVSQAVAEKDRKTARQPAKEVQA